MLFEAQPPLVPWVNSVGDQTVTSLRLASHTLSAGGLMYRIGVH